MVRRATVLKLVREGHTYREAAQRLGVEPGLAYLVATGVATDSTDGLSPEDLARPGLLAAAQELSSPRVEAPERCAHVRAFLAGRAGGDAQMQAAAARAAKGA